MAEKYPGDTDVSSPKGNNYDQNTKALIYNYITIILKQIMIHWIAPLYFSVN